MDFRQHAEFMTTTCLEWKPVLHEDRFKNIIVESLDFLTKANRVTVYGFVIMSNHFHVLWQMVGEHKREDVQRDFLRYTSQQILKLLRNDKSALLLELLVGAKDRTYQVWERNSLSIPVWTNAIVWQKLEYIHNNPVKAGLCNVPEEYVYSSAMYYQRGSSQWYFLKHIDG